MAGGGGVDVLVVDDNPGDRRYITESLQNSLMDVTVHTVNTKDEVLGLVSHRGEYKEAPQPDVILLDWNLAHKTGEEVVNAAKSGESPILVMVMTGTDPERVDLQSTESQADMYIQKPAKPEGYIEALRELLSDQ